MLSGTINKETMCDIFRLLSLQKRSGTLSIASDESKLNINLSEGLITSAEKEKEPLAKGIAKRLVATSCISNKAGQLVAAADVSIPKLLDLLVEKNYLEPDDFIRAAKSEQKDLLYSLRYLTEGTVEFMPCLIHEDNRLSLDVYPTQLLLDILEFELDETRYKRLIEGDNKSPTMLINTDHLPHTSSSAEQIVFSSLCNDNNINSLFEQCLLSQHEVIDALLSLYDQEVITHENSQSKKSNSLGEEFDKQAESAWNDMQAMLFDEPLEESPQEAEEEEEESLEIAPDTATRLLGLSLLEKQKNEEKTNNSQARNSSSSTHAVKQSSKTKLTSIPKDSSQTTDNSTNENQEHTITIQFKLDLSKFLVPINLIRLLMLVLAALFAPSIIVPWLSAVLF